MPKRDFLSFNDVSRAECQGILDLALRMKSGEYAARPLAGQILALLFAKSSTRTRVSFEVGARQLGADALFLSSRDIQLGRGEPIRDTARVLSRYVDGIMIRTFAQSEVEELAKFASIPIINGLTDLLHPCQLLADLLTVQEEWGWLDGRVVAWIGDGNNMANSWIEAAGLFGFELRLACPEGYEPNRHIFEANATRTRLLMTEDPEEAVAGAHVGAPKSGPRWARNPKPQPGNRRLPDTASTTSSSLLPHPMPSCCTASRRIATRKSARPCSKVRVRGSGMRRRIGCTCRRRCWCG